MRTAIVRGRPQRPLPPVGHSILEGLGVYGLRSIEDAVLAGLVTGDPVLLVGSHGSAKTLLAQRVAEALGLRFWAYDAAKANFEDLIGFPIPDSLKEDVVRYARTALSILDKEFVLVDEISRASHSMQSKWLEIIRARKVMGMKLDSLRVVFAAMNPAGDYAGAVPLDRALAGRFAWILPMPEFCQMEIDDRRRIMALLGAEDAPSLGRASTAPDVGLLGFLERATARFDVLRVEIGELLMDYALQFTTALQGARIKVDGRRASMLLRNAAAFLAVRETRLNGSLPRDIEGLRSHLWDAMRLSMPYTATGEVVNDGAVFAAHGMAVKSIGTGAARRAADAVLRVVAPMDPLKAVEAYACVAVDLGPSEHAALVTRIEDAIKARRSAADLTRHVIALKQLLLLYQSGHVRAPADVVRRVFLLFRETIRLDVFPGNEALLQDWVQNPGEALAFRLAAQASIQSFTRTIAGGVFRPSKSERMPEALVAVREELRRVDAGE
jgi:MoxR-like ATPase